MCGARKLDDARGKALTVDTLEMDQGTHTAGSAQGKIHPFQDLRVGQLHTLCPALQGRP
jgi:hypothetical protein